MKRVALCIFSALFILSARTSAQIDNVLYAPEESSICETLTFTNIIVNLGDPLSGLIVTQKFPNTDFVYVPSNSLVYLPDGSVLSNAAAEPVSADGTNLVWDFSAQTGTSTVNHLLLSEVFYHTTNTDPAVEKGFQWIEIYNPMNAPVTVTNWYIEDAAPGVRDDLPAFTIAPGEFVIIAGRTNDFLSMYPAYTGQVYEVADGQIGSGLNHFGDGVILFNEGGTRQDAMSYGASNRGLSPPIPTVAEGHSLERDPANEDTNTRNDWVDQPTPDPGDGNVVVGIMGGESVSIVYQVEVTCEAVSAQFFARAAYEQPPGSAPDSDSSSVFLTINRADLTIRKSPL
jgi:hypothetical protein